MSDFTVIKSVPAGFLLLPSQRVGAGGNERTNNTRQNLTVFASVDGLAVEITNPRTALGQTLDVKVSHFVIDRPGSRFGRDKIIIERKNFAQGDSVIFLDTSHVGKDAKSTVYFYQFDIEVSIGVEVFGTDLGVNVNLFQAPIPLRKPETPRERPDTPPRRKLGIETEVTHVVKPGEFLRQIASQHYGDANKFTIIHEANRAVIGANPNLIHPGQRLKIPQI